MITSYTYTVMNINPDAGAMELMFSAPNMPDVLVGARLPYTDETLDDIAASFAPQVYWANLNRPIATVAVGHSGTITVTTPPVPEPEVGIQQFTPGQTSLTAVRTTPLEFLSLFTEQEQLAITAASLQSPQVRLWYDQLIAATQVINTDPRVAAGLDALVAAGLLTSERRDTILPPTSGLTSV